MVKAKLLEAANQAVAIKRRQRASEVLDAARPEIDLPAERLTARSQYY